MNNLIKAAFFGLFFPSILVSFWVLHSYNEARSYYRVTGHSVTVVDAMFLNLRVVNFPKVEEGVVVCKENLDV